MLSTLFPVTEDWLYTTSAKYKYDRSTAGIGLLVSPIIIVIDILAWPLRAVVHTLGALRGTSW